MCACCNLTFGGFGPRWVKSNEFAARFGFSLDSIQNWEEGLRQPEGPARILLAVIAKNPRAVEFGAWLLLSRRSYQDLGNARLTAVTDILQPRLLATAIMSAQGINEEERRTLLRQWERVTFRIFGLFGKDSRTKIGDYVKIGYRIVTNHIEARTYNQIMAGLRDLGSEYPWDNSEARISPFDAFDRKKKTYLKHSLRMIQQVCDQQDWTLDQIDQRDAQIVAWARARWADI
jgi:hypothetical protein